MKIISVALGLAAGYAAARAMEARAVGLPLDQAFRLDSILKPVTTVKALMATGGVPVMAAKVDNMIDVTPIDVVT